MNRKTAVSAIEQHGILLVFPIDNRREPHSLWYDFFPKSRMRWEWDSDGDDRVAQLWHLREELSRSGKVVYAKWFRGRATFFSRRVFTGLLSHFSRMLPPPVGLSPEARSILATLEESSPLSTKELKRATDLEGRFHAPSFDRATKELWERLLIVGYGERDDGAFPSLVYGATRWMFEDLWEAANKGVSADLKISAPFAAHLRKLETKLMVPDESKTSLELGLFRGGEEKDQSKRSLPKSPSSAPRRRP